MLVPIDGYTVEINVRRSTENTMIESYLICIICRISVGDTLITFRIRRNSRQDFRMSPKINGKV